jgi:hypothetical protein
VKWRDVEWGSGEWRGEGRGQVDKSNASQIPGQAIQLFQRYNFPHHNIVNFPSEIIGHFLV